MVGVHTSKLAWSDKGGTYKRMITASIVRCGVIRDKSSEEGDHLSERIIQSGSNFRQMLLVAEWNIGWGMEGRKQKLYSLLEE